MALKLGDEPKPYLRTFATLMASGLLTAGFNCDQTLPYYSAVVGTYVWLLHQVRPSNFGSDGVSIHDHSSMLNDLCAFSVFSDFPTERARRVFLPRRLFATEVRRARDCNGHCSRHDCQRARGSRGTIGSREMRLSWSWLKRYETHCIYFPVTPPCRKPLQLILG